VVAAAQFPNWIMSRAAIEGLTLNTEARDALVLQTEGNLLAAVQELRKLALAGLANVGLAEVVASSAQSSRFDVSQLGEAVLQGDATRALRVLSGLKAEGQEPTLVLWSVWQEMRVIWTTLVQGAPIAGVWSRNKNLIPQAASRLRPLGRAFFARIDERMARIDRIVKGRMSGNAWDELALLVMEFASGRPVLPSVA
jgi:DNA polymerase III subunit delta